MILHLQTTTALIVIHRPETLFSLYRSNFMDVFKWTRNPIVQPLKMVIINALHRHIYRGGNLSTSISWNNGVTTLATIMDHLATRYFINFKKKKSNIKKTLYLWKVNNSCSTKRLVGRKLTNINTR